jgi:hypothetical protein
MVLGCHFSAACYCRHGLIDQELSPLINEIASYQTRMLLMVTLHLHKPINGVGLCVIINYGMVVGAEQNEVVVTVSFLLRLQSIVSGARGHFCFDVTHFTDDRITLNNFGYAFWKRTAIAGVCEQPLKDCGARRCWFSMSWAFGINHNESSLRRSRLHQGRGVPEVAY